MSLICCGVKEINKLSEAVVVVAVALVALVVAPVVK